MKFRCQNCGVEFDRNRESKYCSRVCYFEGRYGLPEWRERPDGAVYLTTTQNQVALIDNVDLEKVLRHKWHARWRRNRKVVYVSAATKRKNGRQSQIQLGRFLMDAPVGMVVDHINHNPLDNRRCNLRLCTPQQNQMNKRKARNGSSKYKGVSWNAKAGGWYARIGIDNQCLQLGTFETEREAARVYNAAAVKLHGEYACLNELED